MVENIKAVDDSNPAGNYKADEGGRQRKKNKKRKWQRTKEEEFEIVKRESLQSERN